MKVCSRIGKQNQEFRKIEHAMVENGYPRKFAQKEISWQLKKGAVKAKSVDFEEKGAAH